MHRLLGPMQGNRRYHDCLGSSPPPGESQLLSAYAIGLLASTSNTSLSQKKTSRPNIVDQLLNGLLPHSD